MFSDLLTNELGIPKDIEHELRYNCPFCEPNHDYKLYVKVSDDSTNGLWICFKCGRKGNPISFVMEYFGVSFEEALEILEGYGYRFQNKNYIPKDDSLTDEEYLLLLLDTVGKPKTVEEEEEEKLTPPPLPQGFQLLSQNLYNPEAYPFLVYCHKRGFTLNDIIRHNIGYVLDSTVNLPSGRQIRLKNHLVFLTHGDDGQYQYWNTRAIADSYIKSFNAPSKDGEYSKKNTIFNLNIACKTPQVVITEGVPDALTLGESGVGTFGKQVTDAQINLILKSVAPEQPIYVYLDKDAKNEIKKLAERLYERHKETYIVISPTDKDPNSIGKESSWEIIKNHSVKADGVGIIKLML